MNKYLCIVVFGIPGLAQVWAEEAKHVSQYGITWTFDKAYPVGQFCTGDYWVVGPVRITGITTDLHAPGFTPKPSEDGSMVNPGTDSKQGYDNRLKSYDATRNASLVGGKPVAVDNPLVLSVNSGLVSMVSWLYKSEKEAEPGTPPFNGMTKTPRPVTRSAAVLTVLPSAPPEGSFRPPYAGNDKAVKFNVSNLDLSKLKNLPPVANTPDPETLAKELQHPWIDHVHEWLGAMVHPSENMPQYGREMGTTIAQAALLLNLDFSRLPGHPTKDKLLIGLVQLGIDNTGIADNGGGWPNNGGHHLGRKSPILIAGTMLNDPHMKDVGHWKTRFQEDEQTFYVTQAEVDITHSPKWNPDKRGGQLEPYTADDIGMPEWGIRHATEPEVDNRAMSAPYRSVNSPVYPGFVLAARIMGLEEAWNHKALFDYTDRWMKETGGRSSSVSTRPFAANMWKAYRLAQ